MKLTVTRSRPAACSPLRSPPRARRSTPSISTPETVQVLAGKSNYSKQHRLTHAATFTCSSSSSAAGPTPHLQGITATHTAELLACLSHTADGAGHVQCAAWMLWSWPCHFGAPTHRFGFPTQRPQNLFYCSRSSLDFSTSCKEQSSDMELCIQRQSQRTCTMTENKRRRHSGAKTPPGDRNLGNDAPKQLKERKRQKFQHNQRRRHCLAPNKKPAAIGSADPPEPTATNDSVVGHTERKEMHVSDREGTKALLGPLLPKTGTTHVRQRFVCPPRKILAMWGISHITTKRCILCLIPY